MLAEVSAMLGGGQFVDVVLLALLPALLFFSACFSASETALFAMSESERQQIRRTRTIPARAVETLLTDRRMLLITILLLNMTVNVLFFVISSVLMIRSTWGVAGEIVLGVMSLLGVVLLGEVIPKMIANARRVAVAKMLAGPLLALHRLVGPLRIVISRVII